MARISISGSASGLLLLLVLLIVAIIILIFFPLWAIGAVMVVFGFIWPGIKRPWRSVLILLGLLFIVLSLVFVAL